MDSSLLKSPIPTDNLYKFMAISGLIIMCVSYWAPLYLADTMRDQLLVVSDGYDQMAEGLAALGETEEVIIRDEDGQIVTNKFRSIEGLAPLGINDEQKKLFHSFFRATELKLDEWAKAPIDEQDKRAWFKLESVKTRTKRERGFNDEQYDDYVKNLPMDKFREMRRPANQRSKELKPLVKKVERDLSNLWLLEQRNRHYRNLSTIGTVLGCLIMIFGFAWWYERVQKIQDKMLLKESQ